MQEINTSKRKLIAEGYSGKIYLTHINSDNGKKMKAIIKKFNLKCQKHYQIEKDIFQEINPHILFPQVYFTDDQQYEICMEYCKGGTLFDLLIKCGRFEEELAFRYFKQILEALRHLKKHSICHRDIKLENILILRDDRRYLKIVDLSFCAKILKAETKQDRRCFHDNVGTEGYQCPEMLLDQPYSGYEADMFSLGVLLFEMIHGKPPFFCASKKSCEFYTLFCDNRKQYWELFESLAPNKSPELIQLLEQLLEFNPDKRIAMGKVFKQQWFINMSKKQKNDDKYKLDETQIDFGKYKQLSSVYNKSNFLTFLSRVFQNNTLNDSLLKIKAQQKQESNQKSNNKIEGNNNHIDQVFNNQNQQNNLYRENRYETTQINHDLQYQGLNQTFNTLQNKHFLRHQGQNNFMAQNPTNNQESLKTNSLSPDKFHNVKQNLIGNILKTKVLYYEEEQKSDSDDQDNNKYQQERLNTDQGEQRAQNIFQLIRQNCKDDIFLRMSYIQIFSKPVDIQQIKKKYTKTPSIPSYLGRILMNNNFAEIAGFKL
ncbi:Serine/Threonine kinase domain protein (macronuclear) [Tetrahymena thermophila SB210]|uniref:Serine/Threonine kinase domain protein n=1 Tax=Tetrahymena thermophila (strain SB210) TaxID=312017 RepID=Q22NG5_TETTS|nr:Serine/Threonine kinase domain protein [Tetrahymena thermophila SB210]EAR86820.1 Serine/Threonine kinase domain protein [Tetrahymena thermophila SB210]|eukprot:XP_001007065.1 Serine/Threonine kinase domain protein [Tetrahymena thermophila SB210]